MIQLEAIIDKWIRALSCVIPIVVDICEIERRVCHKRIAALIAPRQVILAVAVATVSRSDRLRTVPTHTTDRLRRRCEPRRFGGGRRHRRGPSRWGPGR